MFTRSLVKDRDEPSDLRKYHRHEQTNSERMYHFRAASYRSAAATLATLLSVFLPVSAGNAQDLQAWNLSGAWSIGQDREHEILSAADSGIASPDASSVLLANPVHLRFGLQLRSGQVQVRFREHVDGYYRLVFQLVPSSQSNPSLNLRLEQVVTNATPLSIHEVPVGTFEANRWHDVQVSHVVTDNDDSNINSLVVTCVIDGRQVLSAAHGTDPLTVGTLSFESGPNSNVQLDVSEDNLDQKADQLRSVGRQYGEIDDDDRYITLNRDTFSFFDSTLGRPEVIVQIREESATAYVIDETNLKKRWGYVLPRILTNAARETTRVSPETASDEIAIALPVPRPTIHAVDRYELNALNDPSDSAFDIYGYNLGVERAEVILGWPGAERTYSHTYPVELLTGQEARDAAGNSEGLEPYVRVRADLHDFVSNNDLSQLSMEGEVPLWVRPLDPPNPNLSNRAQIFLNSRWPSEPMYVGYTQRFRMSDDGGGGPDGVPEQYWSFGGATIDAATGLPRTTTLPFPFDRWAPWSGDYNDWYAEIPIFAAEASETTKHITLAAAGTEEDGGENVAKGVLEGLGGGLKSITTGNPLADGILKGAGGTLEGIGSLISNSENEFLGALSRSYLQSDEYGVFFEPKLEPTLPLGEIGPSPTQVQFAVKKVNAPYLKEIEVIVREFRIVGDDGDLVLAARAATGFDGESLREQQVVTVEYDWGEDVWVSRPDGWVILKTEFPRPVLAPFVYIEFAVWEADGDNDDDNCGGPTSMLYFFDEAYPQSSVWGSVHNYGDVTMGSGLFIHREGVDEDWACEIKFEVRAQRWTMPLP